MKKIVKLITLILLPLFEISGQAQQKIDFNKEYKEIPVTSNSTLTYLIKLNKGGIYQFSILQQGIAVYYSLTSEENKMVFECNYPDDFVGYEKFEFSPTITQNFRLTIKRFEDPENPTDGKITLHVKSLTKDEISIRNKIKKELEPENRKNVTTIDIDHFWDAYDNLKKCRTLADSIKSFQELYLDKATNGLLDFIQVRELTAEKFVEAVSNNSSFYQAIRPNSLIAKKAEPVVEEVFAKFSEIYPDFKPFKVCFAIGINNTGGTVSNQFVLIGTEVTTFIKDNNVSSENDIIEKIKGIVAHECVHTQQPLHPDESSIKCPLLYQSLKEGACDFIAELITNKSRSSEYGEMNENKLWTEFKNELCNENIFNWLYNGHSVKDKPSDLGYYIGYEIVKSYYSNSTDKDKSVIEFIGMTDPIQFLQRSKYDQKVKRVR